MHLQILVRIAHAQKGTRDASSNSCAHRACPKRHARCTYKFACASRMPKNACVMHHQFCARIAHAQKGMRDAVSNSRAHCHRRAPAAYGVGCFVLQESQRALLCFGFLFFEIESLYLFRCSCFSRLRVSRRTQSFNARANLFTMHYCVNLTITMCCHNKNNRQSVPEVAHCACLKRHARCIFKFRGASRLPKKARAMHLPIRAHTRGACLLHTCLEELWHALDWKCHWQAHRQNVP